jgi:pyridinium-3,5-bisthiocarboxylic acid mononucleotide nickel chelatase
MPAMSVGAVGYGAGTKTGGPMPNLLRVFVGAATDDGSADTVVELSANIDDCTGEVLGATLEMLIENGCLDAWACPIVMKKSRPAWMLSALCRPADVAATEQLLFRQTTSFGIRRCTMQRTKLAREHRTVETDYGPIRVKVGRLAGEVVTASPEFSDCRQAALAHHVSIKEVFSAADAAFREGTISDSR